MKFNNLSLKIGVALLAVGLSTGAVYATENWTVSIPQSSGYYFGSPQNNQYCNSNSSTQGSNYVETISCTAGDFNFGASVDIPIIDNTHNQKYTLSVNDPPIGDGTVSLSGGNINASCQSTGDCGSNPYMNSGGGAMNLHLTLPSS